MWGGDAAIKQVFLPPINLLLIRCRQFCPYTLITLPLYLDYLYPHHTGGKKQHLAKRNPQPRWRCLTQSISSYCQSANKEVQTTLSSHLKICPPSTTLTEHFNPGLFHNRRQEGEMRDTVPGGGATLRPWLLEGGLPCAVTTHHLEPSPKAPTTLPDKLPDNRRP